MPLTFPLKVCRFQGILGKTSAYIIKDASGRQINIACDDDPLRREVAKLWSPEEAEARALAAEAALAAERERAARVVEDWAEMHAGHLSDDGPTPLGRHRVAMNDGYALAAAIRPEGE